MIRKSSNINKIVHTHSKVFANSKMDQLKIYIRPEKHIAIFALILILGIGLSLFLIPRKHEVALFHLKDKNFSVARKLYEKMLNEGDFSIPTVMPLINIYVQYGEIKKAIGLMKNFIKKYPNNLAARKKLGLLYQYEQLPFDFLTNLEEINQIQKSKANLQQLSKTYDFRGDYKKEIATLKEITISYPDNPNNYLKLSYLQASLGHIKDAVDTLQTLEKKHKTAINNNNTEFFISLLFDLGHPNKAFDKASLWLSNNPDIKIAIRFARLFRYKKENSFALRLLKPFKKSINGNPDLLTVYTELLLVNNHKQEAFEILFNLYKTKNLPESILPLYIEIALERKKYTQAWEVAKKTDLKTLPKWLLAYLTEVAIDLKQQDLVLRIINEFGDKFMQRKPVLVAELFHKWQNKKMAKHWLAVAENSGYLNLNQKIGLAALYNKLGRQKAAYDLYKDMAKNNTIPESSIGDFLSLCLKFGSENEGLALFKNLRKKRSSPQVNAGWTIFAAKASKEKEVINWLDCKKKNEISDQLLMDIYYISRELEQYSLSLVSSECLFRRKREKEDLLRYAEALIKSGQPSFALPYLRPLSPWTKREEVLYREALFNAFLKGDNVIDELKKYSNNKFSDPIINEINKKELIYTLINLRAYEIVLPYLAILSENDDRWLYVYADTSLDASKIKEFEAFLKVSLKNKNLSQETRKNRIYMLTDIAGDHAALPFLKEYADKYGKYWEEYYEETLLKQNDYDKLLTYWKKQVKKPNISVEKKRSIAYKMLDSNFKDEAVNVFLELSRKSPPNSNDVLELLYLWGPRPDSHHIDWLTFKAKTSKDDERAGWINHLVNLGAANKVILLLREEVLHKKRGKLYNAYINALSTIDNWNELSPIIEREISLEKNPDHLKQLIKLSIEHNQIDTVIKLYKTILTIKPNDKDTLKNLGYYAFITENYKLAGKNLSNYLSIEKGTYQLNYFYAEILLHHKKDKNSAKIYFNRALQQIEQISDDSLHKKRLKAMLLYRSGKKSKAIINFEALLNNYPDDKILKADFIEILLDNGDHKRAGEILKRMG